MRKTSMNKYLQRIHWSKPIKNLSMDLRDFCHFFYGGGFSRDNILDVWENISKNNCLAAYLTMELLQAEGVLTDDVDAIENLIIEGISYAVNNDPTNEKYAQALATSILVNNVNHIGDSICLLDYDKRLDVCRLSFEYIEAVKNQETNILRLINHIISESYIDSITLSQIIYKGDYKFLLKEEISGLLEQLLLELFKKGEFLIAANIKNAYGYNYNKLDIKPESFLNYLTNSDDDNFFRGCLIYREIVHASDSLCNLRKWLNSISTIDTDVCKDNLVQIRYLCMLYAIEMDPDNPTDALAYLGIDYSQKNDHIFIRASIVEHYRNACYKLLGVHNGEFLISFLENTEDINTDYYNQSSIRPASLWEHIGTYNEEKLLYDLLHSCNDIKDIIQIYFNSFVRGAINFNTFLLGLKKHFSLDDSDITSIMHGIIFQCCFRYGKLSSYIRGAKNIVPIAVKGKHSDNMIIQPDYVSQLKSLGFDDYYDNKRFSAEIESVELRDEYPIITFKPVIYDAAETIKCTRDYIWAYRRRYITERDFYSFIKNININMLEKDTAYTDICVDLLELIVDIAARDMSECRSFILKIQNINFYRFNPYTSSTFARQYKTIKPEQYRAIRSCWNTLLYLNLEPESVFFIYCNTILRKMYNLEDFLLSFVEEKKQKLFYSDCGLWFTGKIQTHAVSNDDSSSIVIMAAPCAFKIQGDPNKHEKYYTRFLYDLPLNGESRTSLLKKKGIRINSIVTFEIESYEGNGLFKLKNMRIAHEA